MSEPAPLLETRELSRGYAVTARRGLSVSRRTIQAVDGVSLSLAPGETLGIVGESGCGKSTFAKLLLGILPPSSGEIRFAGEIIRPAEPATRASYSRQVQIVYQNAGGSLDPRMRILDQLVEPLRVNRITAAPRDAATAVLAQVGLPAEIGSRFPHQLSGGQAQRVVMARALLFDPAVIVCDEPVSALDLSVQAQVLNLLMQIQNERRLAYVFISHDLRVVRHIAQRVAVMYLGRVVEEAPTQALFDTPRHPYTQSLLDAVPNPDPRRRGSRRILVGEPPSPIERPSGCVFHTRCAIAQPFCRTVRPELKALQGSAAKVACHAVHGEC